MIDFFLKANDKLKLNILQSLIYLTDNRLDAYIELFNSNRSTIIRNISQLQGDLVEISDRNELTVSNTNEYTLTISSSMSKSGLIDELLSHYIRKSNHFLLLNQIIADTTVDRQQILASLFISQPYCNTLVRELNEELSHYTIQIEKNSHHFYYLSGNELRLRHFLYYFQLNFMRNDFLTKARSLPKSEAFLPYPRYRLLIFESILANRQRFDHHQVVPSNELMAIIEMLATKSDGLGSPINHFHLLVTFPQLKSKKQRVALGKEFELADNPFIKDIKAIITAYVTVYFDQPVQEAIYFEYLYYIVLHVAYMFIFECNYHQAFLFDQLTLASSSSEDIVEEVFFEAYQPLLKDLALRSDFTGPNFQKDLVHHIAMLYGLEHPIAVSIYLDTHSAITLELIEQHHFGQLFNQSSIIITDDYQQADLVIVDHNLAQETDKKVFRFSLTDIHREFLFLYHVVVDLYTTKYEQRISKCLLQRKKTSSHHLEG